MVILLAAAVIRSPWPSSCWSCGARSTSDVFEARALTRRYRAFAVDKVSFEIALVILGP
jgi:hypothetical protein